MIVATRAALIDEPYGSKKSREVLALLFEHSADKYFTLRRGDTAESLASNLARKLIDPTDILKDHSSDKRIQDVMETLCPGFITDLMAEIKKRNLRNRSIMNFSSLQWLRALRWKPY